MSALHLVDPGEAGCGAPTLRFVADLLLERQADPAERDCVVVFGHREHARLAQRCGLGVDGLLPFPKVPGRKGTQGLRRLAHALERLYGEIELVHAWSVRTGRLATQCMGDRPCVVSAMIGPQDMSLLERVASISAATVQRTAPLRVLAPNEGAARELLLAGADPDVVRIVHPGVDAALLAERRRPTRAALRARWGVDDETLLVGLVTQPVAWGDARSAASIVTLPVTANRDVKLLVHPDAARLHAAYEWSRPLDFDHCLIQEADLAEPWRVLAGLDVALWLGNDRTAYGLHRAPGPRNGQPLPSVLPLLWSMSAGVPVMAERCAATSELIQHGENGMLIEPRDVTGGAKQIVALCDDAELRRALGAAGQRCVASHFTIALAAQRVGQVYDELGSITGTKSHRVNTSTGRKSGQRRVADASPC